MMRLTRPTLVLAALAGLLALLLLLDRDSGRDDASLPRLPAIRSDEVTRVTFTRSGETLVVTRTEDRWRITRPLDADADGLMMEALLSTFKDPIPMDFRVDVGNLDKYGADDNAGVTFEVFGAAADPLLSMVVGNDVPGGSTLLRLAGSDAVYRARVGGRFQYDRPAVDWRNHTLLGVDADTIATITLRTPRETLTFQRPTRSDADMGPARWVLAEDVSFPTDQRLLDALARSLASLRATSVHSSDYGEGWEDPPLTLEIQLEDASTHELVMVPGTESTLARVDGATEVYQLPALALQRLSEPRSSFQDHTLMSFQRSDIAFLQLEVQGKRVRLKQDVASGIWSIVEPVRAEADVRLATATATALASLKADKVMPDAAPSTTGLAPPAGRLTVELLDGSQPTLLLGTTFADESGTLFRYVKSSTSSTTFALREQVVTQLRSAFSGS